MNWSIETYRLDEVEGRFPLPCVIQVNEGFYSLTDAEGFSQGDILSIDKKVVLHKVAANFAYEKPSSTAKNPDYVDLVKNEILVPLNYRGKLKVLRHLKNYDSVSELAQDFPRYAKLRENLTVRTEDNVSITIQAGVVVELDRIIPGSTYGPKIEPDKLVIQFDHLNRTKVVGIPLTSKGKFRTEPDENKYTIKEAIDRYCTPQYVKFVDDEIKRVYTQDLMEGLANMKTITETLRLNRLLTQTVLVGHYKPVEETAVAGADGVRQRTLIVLPLDNKEIREIEVNVLKGASEDDYADIFMVRNVSNTDELVDGSLYVDFAEVKPGIKRIIHRDVDNRTNEEIPPPIPPKPRRIVNTPIATGPSSLDVDDYILPDPPNKIPGTSVGLSLADVDFTREDDPVMLPERAQKKKHTKFLFGGKNKKGKDKRSGTGKHSDSKQEKPVYSDYKSPMPIPIENNDNDSEKEKLDVYEELNEHLIMDARALTDFQKKHEYKQPPSPRPVLPNPPALPNRPDHPPESPKSPRGKLIARVEPSFDDTREKQTTRKMFRDLNCHELVDRLKFCGLAEFADVCEKERLNGAFFDHLSDETLRDAMDLKGLRLAKFMQMRDENWVPT